LVILSLFSLSEAANPNCTTYCNAVGSYCTSYLAVGYQDVSYCLEACQTMTKGSDTDTTGNTAGCRQYHAIAAGVSNPTVNCAAASVSGGEVCGTPCESYCFFMSSSCWQEFSPAGTATFNNPACLSICQAVYPNTGVNYPIDQSGDSVQCRLYHASASWVNAGIHCPHASISGAGVCGTSTTPVDAFCRLANSTCHGTFVDISDCQTKAAAFNESDILSA